MNYSEEEWKPAVGLEGIYDVSSYGRVRRIFVSKYCPREAILKGHINGDGYVDMLLSNKNIGLRKHMLAHTLVAAAFIGPCPSGMGVNHKNFIKTDNSASNLEYMTPADNKSHAVANGHFAFGSRNGRAKVKEGDIPIIKKLYLAGMSQQTIGDRYGVSQNAISEILLRKKWKHVA